MVSINYSKNRFFVVFIKFRFEQVKTARICDVIGGASTGKYE